MSFLSERFRQPRSFISMPGWPLAVRCPWPGDDPEEHVDICLTGVWCDQHARTVYYCAEHGALYCDGMSHDQSFHPHIVLPRAAEADQCRSIPPQ